MIWHLVLYERGRNYSVVQKKIKKFLWKAKAIRKLPYFLQQYFDYKSGKYINGLFPTCVITNYAKKHQLTIPLDYKGRCILHSTDLAWKRANNCGGKFWELLYLMAEDEMIENIDFREFHLTGLVYEAQYMDMRKVNQFVEKALVLDFFLKFQDLWERYGLARQNNSLNLPIIESIMIQDGKAISKELKEKFDLTVNINIENILKDNRLEAGGDIHIGHLTKDYFSTKNKTGE